jgi:transposase-like protein
MDRDELARLLDEGWSLERIGRHFGRDGSTVVYWVQKHGLRAAHADHCAPRGGLDRDELTALIDEGLTIQEMAERLGRSSSTVQYWLRRHELKTQRARREHVTGPLPRRVVRECRTHGASPFILEGRGYYRCTRCRMDRVAARRGAVKKILVEEAGGGCAACGYTRYVGALQFHHIDPSEKVFAIARRGWTRSLAKAREEASKCVLLCANCHAEIEAGVANLPGRKRE